MLAFLSSRDGLSADAAACLTVMSRSARGIGERAVEIGARQLREEDPEVALLLSAPKLPLSSEELEKFQRAGAVKIVADMSEELRERKELGP